MQGGLTLKSPLSRPGQSFHSRVLENCEDVADFDEVGFSQGQLEPCTQRGPAPLCLLGVRWPQTLGGWFAPGSFLWLASGEGASSAPHHLSGPVQALLPKRVPQGCCLPACCQAGPLILSGKGPTGTEGLQVSLSSGPAGLGEGPG